MENKYVQCQYIVAFELLLSLKKFRGKVIWWRKYNTIGNKKVESDAKNTLVSLYSISLI